ncbi:MAG: hypothetical protein ABW048_13450, partial [Sphingobium sp.]
SSLCTAAFFSASAKLSSALTATQFMRQVDDLKHKIYYNQMLSYANGQRKKPPCRAVEVSAGLVWSQTTHWR